MYFSMMNTTHSQSVDPLTNLFTGVFETFCQYLVLVHKSWSAFNQQEAGCKESLFYSLPFRQAVASMY